MELDLISEKLDEIKKLTIISAKTILRSNEAAVFTGLSIGRIYRLTSDSEIPHYKRGNTLYFKKSELEEWMLERIVKTTEEIASEAEAFPLRRRSNRTHTRA